MTEPKVSRIYSEKPASAEVNQAAHDLDEAVQNAIQAAKQAGMPQGLLVGMLHTYAAEQTGALIRMKAEA